MSDWDRYVVIGCMIGVALGSLALMAPVYIAYARRRRGIPPPQKPMLSGIVGNLLTLGLIFAPTLVPMIPVVLLTSLDTEELLYLLLSFFLLSIGLVLCAFAPLIGPALALNPLQPLGPVKTALMPFGCVLVSFVCFLLASWGVRDFVLPLTSIEGRVERKWITTGRYLEHKHVRLNGKDYGATWKAYEAAIIGWPFRAEVGAGSGRIYRMEPLRGGSMRPQP